MPFRASIAAGRTPVETYTGIPFAATVYANTAASVLGATKYAVLRCRLDAAPPTGDGCLAGNSSFGPDGFIFEAADAEGHTGFGRLDVFGGGGYTATFPHIPLSTEIGRYLTLWCWLDTSAGAGNEVLRWGMGGEEIGKGLAVPGLVTLANGKMSLNTRAGFAGTFQYGSWTFIELAVSTVEPTRIQILADSLAIPGTAFEAGGETHRWLASGSGAVGDVATSIPDSVGVQPLVIVGVPSANVAVAARRKQGLGTVVLAGDSTTRGHSGGTDGDTWRKAFAQHVIAANRDVAIMGETTVANVTFDYDYRCNATGGQALNQLNGIVPSRFSSVATDRASGIPTTARLVLWYWLNDVALRIGNGDNAAVAAAHMATDFDTYLTAWRTRVTGPVLIIGPTRQTLAAAGSQTILDAADLYYAAFDAMITTLDGVHGNIFGLNSLYALDPSDMALFIDGTHPSVLCNETIIAPAIANALMDTL